MPKAKKVNIIYDQIKVEQIIKRYVNILHQVEIDLPIKSRLYELLEPCQRPLNQFMLFKRYIRPSILTDIPHATIEVISKETSERWNLVGTETKRTFEILSQICVLIKKELMGSTNDNNEGHSASSNKPWEFSAAIPQMILSKNSSGVTTLNYTRIVPIDQNSNDESILDNFLNRFDSYNPPLEDRYNSNVIEVMISVIYPNVLTHNF
ncbi:11634_t:CDS:1 [Funneliformis caledonium]|uniref:11634_t:CDS:1 n=1 Tax=Funneliformis caledonium TaxID=1117310 RepID=A0A9N9AY08_9GLOM|nr:11634_t:CDS:1 [Funneliformis caledonium]